MIKGGFGPSSFIMEVSLDFETRSLCDLKRAGAYRYAEDPTTSAWCAAYSADGEEPGLWTPDVGGRQLHELACDKGIMWRAWNAQFERAIWREVMHRRFGFPDIPAERWICTAAEARAMNLPGKLDDSARVLGVVQQKDMSGHRLMLQMCRPRKILADGTIIWWDEPEKMQRLFDYCKQDVRTELAVKERVQRLTDYERRIFVMDMKINDRGIKLDHQLAQAAKELSETVKHKADYDIQDITNGFVGKVSNVGRLRTWVNAVFGLDGTEPIESLSKKSIAKLLDDEFLPQPVREALEVRVATGKSSVKKVDSMLKAMCSDSILRGLLLIYGAGTGRWAGRLVQPQNFPARTGGLPEWWVDWYFDSPEAMVRAVLNRDEDTLALEGAPLEVMSMMLRSMLIARHGKLLVAADYSAIEARVAAWLVNCAWRLEVFRTHGKIYEASAAMMFKLDITQITKALRQRGKVAELALGFQGGENALITMGAYEYGLDDSELTQIKEAWRTASPEFPAAWKELNHACIDAVMRPGSTTEALDGRVRMRFTGGFLFLKLPSGRRLAYAKPRIVWKPAPWDATKNLPSVEAWAVNSKTKQWSKRALYGGLLFENIVQATARDLMADAMLRMDEGGIYAPLLSVHDEVIAEADEAKADVAAFEQLMCDIPSWADGCPVKAVGWAGPRYRH